MFLFSIICLIVFVLCTVLNNILFSSLPYASDVFMLAVGAIYKLTSSTVL